MVEPPARTPAVNGRVQDHPDKRGHGWTGLIGLIGLIATHSAHPTPLDVTRLRQEAARYVESSTRAAHPDAQARVEIGEVDARLRLSDCAEPRFSLPAGARTWGGGHLAVRCMAPAEWTLYLTYRIRLSGPGLVTRRPLAVRAQLSATDVESAVIEYDQDPGLYPRHPDELAGSQASRPLAKGTPIRVDMLRRPPAVRSGQKVRLLAHGAGFTVSQEGVAQQTVAAGETVRVRLGNGRVVQGIAERDGSVRVSP